MEEVEKYLKECGVFYLATAVENQPYVRPFGAAEIINGRLYLLTGKKKDVFKQLAQNPKFEICATKPSGTEWMRLSGELMNDDSLEVKEEYLRRNESLRSMYSANDGNMAVLYIRNATARFFSFTAPVREVKF